MKTTDQKIDDLTVALGATNEKIDDLATAVKRGFDEVDERFTGVEGRLGGVETKLGNLEKTVANLPDKAYLSDKLADLEGATIVRERKSDERFRLLVAFLRETQALTEDHARRLAQFVIFPAPPAL